MEAYDFGLRLKELRQLAGYSQNDVAKKLDVSVKTISAYERNIQTPRLEKLIQMARMYHASLDYIANLADQRNCIYLDDLPPERQQAIISVVDVVIKELERCDK